MVLIRFFLGWSNQALETKNAHEQTYNEGLTKLEVLGSVCHGGCKKFAVKPADRILVAQELTAKLDELTKKSLG